MLFALGPLAASVGCKSVRVTMERPLRYDVIEVHVVGVNEGEYDRWHEITMNEYWWLDCRIREQAVRQGYAYVMQFRKGSRLQRTLDEQSDTWAIWRKRNARYVFVLAHLWKLAEDPGHREAWRGIYPIGPWPRGGQLECLIGQYGVYFGNASGAGPSSVGGP